MKKLTKKVYEMLNRRYLKMLNESIPLASQWESDYNLKKISKKEYEKKVDDWENEIFAIAFQVWNYELKIAFTEYNKCEKKFIENHRMGFVDLINSTQPDKKFNFKVQEKINKLTREIVEDAYKKIVTISRNVPLHGINKNKFPLAQIDLDKDILT